MLVRTLVSWAGPNWFAQPGDEIDLPEEIAAARIEAGLAEPLDDLDLDQNDQQPPRRRTRKA